MGISYSDLSAEDRELIDAKHAASSVHSDKFNQSAAVNLANGSRHPHDLIRIITPNKHHMAQRLERLRSMGLSHEAIERNL